MTLPSVPHYGGCQVTNCGQACGFFIPEGAAELTAEALLDPKYIASKCVVCGHYGSQHIAPPTVVSLLLLLAVVALTCDHLQPVAEPTQASASAPPTFTAPSPTVDSSTSASTARPSSHGAGRAFGATAASLSGSRSGTLPTFLSQAEKREQREKGPGVTVEPKKFDPTATVRFGLHSLAHSFADLFLCVQAYEATSQLKSKAVPHKRKKTVSSESAPNSQRASGKKTRIEPAVPVRKYTVVLADRTDEVYANEYPKPNLKK